MKIFIFLALNLEYLLKSTFQNDQGCKTISKKKYSTIFDPSHKIVLIVPQSSMFGQITGVNYPL